MADNQIHIQLNGERQLIPSDFTAQQLVERLGLADERIAMEVNLDIVPRSAYTQHQFTDGDKVEIVRAIGGG
jgi:sulfur carrier protein